MSGNRGVAGALDLPLVLGRRAPGEGQVAPRGAAVAPAPGVDAGADEALVQQVAMGSAAAFEALFERYRDRVFQFVLWQLDSRRDLAEELTQEIFYQLYRSAATFRQRSRFRTWLYSLARNVCRHHERKHRRERRALDWEAVEEAPQLAEGWSGNGPDALERLAAAEVQARVRRAVASLPRLQRTVLVLRDWEDLSYQEIAVILEVPVGTVRSRLHNARGALARELGGAMEARRGL